MPHYHRIRAVRLQLQVSIRTFADLLGVGIKSARDIESPENDVGLARLRVIARHFRVPVTELIVEDEGDELHQLRGFVVRVIKVCVAMEERSLASGEGMNLVKMLKARAVELLPEAAEVHDEHFHSLRPGDEPGRIAGTMIPVDAQVRDGDAMLLQNG